MAQGLPPKGLRSPGDGGERGRARNVPTRARHRTQQQVSRLRVSCVPQRRSMYQSLLLITASVIGSVLPCWFLFLSTPLSHTQNLYPFRLFVPSLIRASSCHFSRWLQEQVRVAKAEVVSTSKVEAIESVDVSILFAMYLFRLLFFGVVSMSSCFFSLTSVFPRLCCCCIVLPTRGWLLLLRRNCPGCAVCRCRLCWGTVTAAVNQLVQSGWSPGFPVPPQAWILVFESMSDSRERLSTLAHLWNQCETPDRCV